MISTPSSSSSTVTPVGMSIASTTSGPSTTTCSESETQLLHTTTVTAPRCEATIVGSPELFSATVNSSKPQSNSVQSGNGVPEPASDVKDSNDEIREDISESADSTPVKNGPTMDQLLSYLVNWHWVQVDQVPLPVIIRNGDPYAAVNMVQLKLLGKFPPGIPSDFMQRFTMTSHHMTEIEACVFNAVNVVSRSFDLGCHVYTTKDEVVRLHDALAFYWHAKEFNLLRTLSLYEHEINNASSTAIASVLNALKQEVTKALDKARLEIVNANQLVKKAGDPIASSTEFNGVPTVGMRPLLHQFGLLIPAPTINSVHSTIAMQQPLASVPAQLQVQPQSQVQAQQPIQVKSENLEASISTTAS